MIEVHKELGPVFERFITVRLQLIPKQGILFESKRNNLHYKGEIGTHRRFLLK